MCLRYRELGAGDGVIEVLKVSAAPHGGIAGASPQRTGGVTMAGRANSRDVVQRPDKKWGVTKPGSQRASTVAPTQAEAIRRAREILNREGGGELRVHSPNGVIRDQRTIAPGNDPYPPKG